MVRFRAPKQLLGVLQVGTRCPLLPTVLVVGPQPELGRGWRLGQDWGVRWGGLRPPCPCQHSRSGALGAVGAVEPPPELALWPQAGVLC